MNGWTYKTDEHTSSQTQLVGWGGKRYNKKNIINLLSAELARES